MAKKKRQKFKNSSQQNMIVMAMLLMIISFFLGIFVSKKTEEKKPTPVPIATPFPPITSAPLIMLPPPEITKPPLQGYIAIIIDDWGYTKNLKEYLRTIDVPLAVAILPKLPHSRTIAEYAKRNNKEIMLHLPMEPHYNADKYPKDYIIKSGMPIEKIRKIISESLNTVPFAQGINNHMGSKATENRDLMRTVLLYLKEKNFFFVDSYVSEKSIAKDVAQNLNVAFIKRDVFLDNVADRSMIEGEFAKLAHLAQRNGYAVAIGHARPLTLEVIKEQAEILRKRGFVFLTVREMIKRAKILSDP